MKTVSLLLASLLLLQACAGSVTRGAVSSSLVGEPTLVRASAPAEEPTAERPKRRWWPWIVGAAAVAVVATGVFFAVAFHNFEPGVGDFDFGFGGSGSNERDQDDGGTLPLLARR